MRLLMIGPPGAGKGTQCERLAQKYGLTHLSSGDIFRLQIVRETDLGKAAKAKIDDGQLVPDDIVISIMKEEIAGVDDWILDGFPRTYQQAEALDEALEILNHGIDAVLVLIVDDKAVASRLTKRRICSVCGTSYNLEFHKPSADNICDKCGGKLVQRDDDKYDVILSRLEAYPRQTEPIIDYYRHSKTKLIEIDAQGDIDDVTGRLVSSIESLDF